MAAIGAQAPAITTAESADEKTRRWRMSWFIEVP
jgi:hypothetical protein